LGGHANVAALAQLPDEVLIFHAEQAELAFGEAVSLYERIDFTKKRHSFVL